MENSTQTDVSFADLAKDIYAKLDSIQSVLGYILEKTKHIPEPERFTLPDYSHLGFNQDDAELDAKDAEGTVLPVE
jgi:hypothetical protein